MATDNLSGLLYQAPSQVVHLVDNIVVASDGAGAAFSGFARANSLDFSVTVRRRTGTGSIALTVQHSADGETWANLTSFSPMTTALHHPVEVGATADPGWDDQLRVAFVLTGTATWMLSADALAGASFSVAEVGASSDGGSHVLATRTVALTAADVLALTTSPAILIPGSPGKQVLPLAIMLSVVQGSDTFDAGGAFLLVTSDSQIFTYHSDSAANSLGLAPSSTQDLLTFKYNSVPMIPGEGVIMFTGDPMVAGDGRASVTSLYALIDALA